MVNYKLTIITVTFNNINGLVKTLDSLCNCITKPFEIIVIDGGSKDGTSDIITKYEKKLPLIFFSEPDDGIYSAMNKGRGFVKTPLVHYLNSGDYVEGDIYNNCDWPCLLPVKIFNPENNLSWFDTVKLSGFGYCHQGIIFPSSHAPFNESLKIAADFEVICRTFINGSRSLPICNVGHVVYELGGVSSVKSEIGNREIISIANKVLGRMLFLRIYLYILLKGFLPRPFRRVIAKINLKRISKL